MNISEIVLVTSNPNKLRIFNQFFETEMSHQALNLPEIQSLDLVEIATQKAKTAYEIIGKPTLVEDVDLVFHSLNGLPGPLVRWFQQSVGLEGMCKMLDIYEDRSATASVVYALAYADGVETFRGEMHGTIAKHPVGDRQFGWSPIFIPEGFTTTLGEMSDEEVAKISMRTPALTSLRDYLSK